MFFFKNPTLWFYHLFDDFKYFKDPMIGFQWFSLFLKNERPDGLMLRILNIGTTRRFEFWGFRKFKDLNDHIILNLMIFRIWTTRRFFFKILEIVERHDGLILRIWKFLKIWTTRQSDFKDFKVFEDFGNLSNNLNILMIWMIRQLDFRDFQISKYLINPTAWF